METCVGVVRVGPDLRAGIEEIERIGVEHALTSRVLRNRAIVCHAIAQAALARRETRGSHARRDYPVASDEYAHRSFITPESDAATLGSRENA